MKQIASFAKLVPVKNNSALKVALSPGHCTPSFFLFHAKSETTKTWEWPGDEATHNNNQLVLTKALSSKSAIFCICK